MPSHAWKDKSIVVCGASSGFGEAIALAAARQGAGQIALLARSPGPLQECTKRLKELYPSTQIHPIVADLSDREMAGSAAERCRELCGVPDLVVQAVGMSDRGRCVDLTPERLTELITANLSTSLNTLAAFSNSMARPGHIVLVGSLASLFAPRYLGGYAMVKHALAALAQQARLELASQDISVTLVCPGPIARRDAEQRYAKLQTDELPPEALQPAGGAKIKGLDPERLADELLAAAANRRPLLVRPRKSRLLWILSTIAPSWADRLLLKFTS